MGTDINVEFINTLDLIHKTISSSKDFVDYATKNKSSGIFPLTDPSNFLKSAKVGISKASSIYTSVKYPCAKVIPFSDVGLFKPLKMICCPVLTNSMVKGFLQILKYFSSPKSIMQPHIFSKVDCLLSESFCLAIRIFLL